MAHFNTALNRQLALAVGRAVARHHIAQVGHGMSGSGRSRPQLTPVMWKSTSLAPQIQSAIRATSRSATIFKGFFRPMGPR